VKFKALRDGTLSKLGITVRLVPEHKTVREITETPLKQGVTQNNWKEEKRLFLTAQQ